MSTLLESFAELGAKIEAPTGKCPFTLCGPVRGGKTHADGASSQFLSSLLFSLPLAENDSVIDLDFLNEKPYVGITTSWLDDLGIKYRSSADLLHWEIPGGQKIAAFEKTIAADFSTAAFPLIAGMIAGNGVDILNLDFNDPQGDKKVFDAVEKMGAKLRRGRELHVLPGCELKGFELDLNSTPDALPILAVAAAFAKGTTALVNVPQARFKECDRIAAMSSELRKMGAEITELEDGMIIRGGKKLHGAEVDSYHDHRIAMAAAVAACIADGEVTIDGAEAVRKSYPHFFEEFAKRGMTVCLRYSENG
jgi:3-phosphoshikimate 1-carboxyvinyltransferase